MDRTTHFSPCRKYRYTLWRDFEPLLKELGFVLFICLNPSTADETKDDQTIRKCTGFARRWGFGAFCMVNLFAYRATLPKDMLAAEEPIGAENDSHIQRLAAEASFLVAGWGNNGGHMNRSQAVIDLIRKSTGKELNGLKITSEGQPYHPLYLKYSAVPLPLPFH